jgi:hypothetical protein
VIGGRHARESARRDEAVPVPDQRVTWGTINVVALASAFENFFGHRERHVVAGTAAGSTRIEICILVQLPAGDCAFHGRTLGALVSEKIAAGKWILPGLDVHIQTTGGENGDAQ